VRDELIVRVGAWKYEESLREAHVRPVDFTGRPMKGYVFVESAGCQADKAPRCWIERGVKFAATLDGTRVRRRKARRSSL
jgi:hypothetical protein